MTSVRAEMEYLLKRALMPQRLEIIDDSGHHQGHGEAGSGQETHFTIFIVSSAFEGMRALQRHRLVQNVLKDLLSSKIHALSLKLRTPEEVQEI